MSLILIRTSFVESAVISLFMLIMLDAEGFVVGTFPPF